MHEGYPQTGVDMRIAFNATSLLSPLTGIGQYSRELAQGLIDRPDIDTSFFYGTNWSRSVRSAPLPGGGKVLPWLRKNIPNSYALRRAVQQNRFTRVAKPAHFDLYHEPNILSLPFDGPTVITIHDVSWIRHPGAHPVERVRAMDRYFPATLLQASQIITDSQFVRQELLDLFGLPPDSVQSIPLGVDRLFQPLLPAQTLAVMERHRLVHGSYFMTVGTLEPRKNLQTALDAFLSLPAAVRQHYPLLMAGMPGWNSSALEQKIASSERTGDVRRLGYLTRVELAQVLSGATALVFPSVYEGFGLPPLEAMACGVPVIASNAASIPEVVGDCGILVDPFDVCGLSEAMRHLAQNADERKAMAEKGLLRSRQYSWEACVEETVQTYHRVLDKRGLTPRSPSTTATTENR